MLGSHLILSPQTCRKSGLWRCYLREEEGGAALRTQEAAGTWAQTDCGTCSPQVSSETVRRELDLQGDKVHMGARHGRADSAMKAEAP